MIGFVLFLSVCVWEVNGRPCISVLLMLQVCIRCLSRLVESSPVVLFTGPCSHAGFVENSKLMNDDCDPGTEVNKMQGTTFG